MLRAAQNDLIVTIEKKFQDKVGSLFIDTRMNPGEHATIMGDVISVPRTISKRIDYTGYSTEDIRPGDKVLMRYDVVLHYRAQPKRENPLYKFEMFYKGQSYWRCDIQKVFAVIRGEEIIMVNGYVMLEPFQPPTKLFIPGHLKNQQLTTSSTVLYIGKPLQHLEKIDVQPGDEVWFNPKKAQTYHIGNKQFIILKQTQILGKPCN